MNEGMKALFEVARKARENSYSPYSKAKVGAAIRTADGKIYGGCNIENSTYGATVCAERAAVSSCVSNQGAAEIVEVMVVTDATPAWSPCGICRQVLSEFGPKARIHLANLSGEVRTTDIATLLPDAFTPAHLHKK